MLPDVLAHGRTVADAWALADVAARGHFSSLFRPADRTEIARFAITAALLEAATPPSDGDLVRAGRNAISAAVEAENHHLGISREGATRPRFATYWAESWSPWEDRVIESLALHQIWDVLSPGCRRDLLALAEHGDRAAAARALGADASTYKKRLGHARAEFRQLWHDGEEPSRHWGRDRQGAGQRHGAVVYAMRRRAQRRATAAFVDPVNAA